MGVSGGNNGNRPGGAQGRSNRSSGARSGGSRPAGARPTVAPRPAGNRTGAPRGNRYAPPSPKRPSKYRRNGCANIAIGGVVVGIILLIVLLNIIRTSCTGCIKDTDSDVSGFGSTASTSSGSSSSTPSNSSSTTTGDSDSSTSSSYVPPKPTEPVIPVLTLAKNKPAGAFSSDCVVDELGWFNDTKAAGESLKFVYDKLGIQPYVVFKKYDSSLKTDEDKVKYCVDWYKEHINNEDTFLLMYFAEKASSSDVGYSVYYSGANAEKLAVEFKWILEDGMNEYWFTEMSTDDVIKYAFEYTCDRITIKTETPPASTPTSSSSSNETSEPTEEPTTEESNDTTD